MSCLGLLLGEYDVSDFVCSHMHTFARAPTSKAEVESLTSWSDAFEERHLRFCGIFLFAISNRNIQKVVVLVL